jgi:muramoyltetrapeptide carboxypeptidase LdcA involved in peptidoglycan recycling
MLHGMGLAGWFDNANAVLIGRPAGPNDDDDFTQFDAIADALGMLTIPVIYDMDFGHVPPQGVLINGALARVQVNESVQTITQTTA